jgi:lipopolysaccharide/colanic/teichoic acid biosynthesis glycosyltransferase
MASKRVFDLVVSAAALAFLSPLLLVIAVFVWLDSGWPFLYSQERIGRGFRPFRIYKFRTMRPNSLGPAITASGDPRITRVGAVLRATKADELPQLWNVLKGEMSLVGPRPEIRQYVELYRASYARLLTLRPGLTDPASVAFRDEEAILGAIDDPEEYYRDVLLPRKLELAQRYVERCSLRFDVQIVLNTLAALIRV